ncbi:MAG: hypothetical protein IJ512_03470, partial [Ruminococcus sp.]|nr:hypothetical protein [Ruminococcus sp.]
MKIRPVLRRLPCFAKQNWMQHRRQLSVQEGAAYRPIGFAEQVHYRNPGGQAEADAEQLVQIMEMLLQLCAIVQNQKPSPVWQNYIWNVQYQAEEKLRQLRIPEPEVQQIVREVFFQLQKKEGFVTDSVRETLRVYAAHYREQYHHLKKERDTHFRIIERNEKSIRLRTASRSLLSSIHKYEAFSEKREDMERIVFFLREQERVVREKNTRTIQNLLQGWIAEQQQPLQEAIWRSYSEYALSRLSQQTPERLYLENEQVSAIQKLQHLIAHFTGSELYHLIRSMSQTEKEYREQLKIHQMRSMSLSYAVSASQEELSRIVRHLSVAEQEQIRRLFAVSDTEQTEIRNISWKTMLSSMTQETFLTGLKKMVHDTQEGYAGTELRERLYSSENIMKLLVYHTAVERNEKKKWKYAETAAQLTSVQKKLLPYTMIFSVAFATYLKQQLAKTAEPEPEMLLDMYTDQISETQTMALKRKTVQYENELRMLFSERDTHTYKHKHFSEDMILQSDFQYLLQQTQLQTLVTEQRSRHDRFLEKNHLTDEIRIERYVESLTESERIILTNAVTSVTMRHVNRTEKSLTEQLYSLTETEQEELWEYLNERYIGQSVREKLTQVLTDKTLISGYTESLSETERTILADAVTSVTMRHVNRTEKSLTEQLYSLTETEQ